MARLPKAFKTVGKEKMRSFSAVPTGDYFVKAVESSYDQTFSKNGHVLKLKFEIVKGDHKGSRVFANLNLDNPSDQAVEIAEAELATLCEAVGKKSIRDSKELHGIILVVKVKFTKDNDDKEGNDILMYWSVDDYKGNADDDEDEAEEEEEEEEAEDEDDDDDEEVSVDVVAKAATKLKGMTSLKEIKKLLSEYDISRIISIKTLDKDDLSSLYEDIKEAIEDEE